jgi:molybdopterin-guanine dinucleotide biosynthesis protein A
MNGLILAGGHSRRMGQPKSLLNYRGRPQYEVIAELLKPLCWQIYISCRDDQRQHYAGLDLILDNPAYGRIGPLNGVLSAFEKARTPWFVLACDYPLLEAEDVGELYEQRDPDCVASAFVLPQSGLAEPVATIYEPAAAPLLEDWWRSGHESLQRFLGLHHVHRVLPTHPERLQSVDTVEGYAEIKRRFDLGL